MVAGEAIKDLEPLDGELYRPRKVRFMLHLFQTNPDVATVQNCSCGNTY
jgi:hypothetical protein